MKKLLLSLIIIFAVSYTWAQSGVYRITDVARTETINGKSKNDKKEIVDVTPLGSYLTFENNKVFIYIDSDWATTYIMTSPSRESNTEDTQMFIWDAVDEHGQKCTFYLHKYAGIMQVMVWYNKGSGVGVMFHYIYEKM